MSIFSGIDQKAAQEQVKHFEKESKRTDIYRIIEKLATRIILTYNEKNKDLGSSIYESKCWSQEQQIIAAYCRENIYITDAVNSISNDLKSLIYYINKYEDVSNYEEIPLLEFYTSEYREIAKTLFDIGLLDKKTHELYINKSQEKTDFNINET